jgi:hypothetical protein
LTGSEYGYFLRGRNYTLQERLKLLFFIILYIALRSNQSEEQCSSRIINSLRGEAMGDKSPKSKEKAQKQKDSDKAKAVQKAQSEQDAKKVNTGKAKK